MIKLVKASRKYNERVYGIKDIDLILPDKGLVLVCGESGAGKTTLLNVLTASDSITSGELYYRNVRVYEENMEDYRSQYVAIVYQDFELINSMSVYDNVALGASVAGEASQDKIHKILERLNILNLKDSLITECSGGEVQRASIARALAKETDMIFADEPTGNLDSKNSENILQLLKEISRDKLVVLVSHDVKRAAKYSDYCIELEDGMIIKNDCPTEEIKEGAITEISKVRPRVPSGLLYKLSQWNIGRNNLKPIFNIAIIALIMSILYLLLPLAVYDYPLVLSKNLKRAELPLIRIHPASSADPYEPLSDVPDKWGLKSYPITSGLDNDLNRYYHENDLFHNNGVYVIDLSPRLTEYDESFGLEFVYGSAPEHDYEVAISLTQAYNILSMKAIYNSDKEIVEIDSLEELIGKCFFMPYDFDMRMVITGIVEDYYYYREHQENGTVSYEHQYGNDYRIASENFLVGMSYCNAYTFSLRHGLMRGTACKLEGDEDFKNITLKPLVHMESLDYNLSKDGILINKYLADNNGIQLGDTIAIIRDKDNKTRTFVVEYISDKISATYMYTNPDTYLDEYPDIGIYEHIVNIGYKNQLKKLRQIEKALGGGRHLDGFYLDFVPRMKAINSYSLEDIAGYLTDLSIVLFIPISIGLVIILFLNTNALTNYSISQSMRDFSILRSIGYDKRNIRNIITLKSLLVAIPQIVIGIVIGWILIALFNWVMSKDTITHIIIISLDIKKFLIINVVAVISYILVILSKSRSIFTDSAVMSYKKR